MISLSYKMILNNTLFACFSGVVSGFLHFIILRFYKHFRLLIARNRICQKNTGLGSVFVYNAYGFLIAMLVGIVYIISTYAFMDGAFHIYPLIALFVSFRLSMKCFTQKKCQVKKRTRAKKL